MNNPSTQDLELLRDAAYQREWNTLQDTLQQLLTWQEPLPALSVAVNRAQSFLPTFEAYYPEARWVRELLLRIVNFGMAPTNLPLEALAEFTAPGCGNFIMAVFEMARAVQAQIPLRERYGHITNAVANAILADLQHSYYSQHESEYDLILATQADQNAAVQAQYGFWLDADIAHRDTAIWLEIANEVEEMLRG